MKPARRDDHARSGSMTHEGREKRNLAGSRPVWYARRHRCLRSLGGFRGKKNTEKYISAKTNNKYDIAPDRLPRLGRTYIAYLGPQRPVLVNGLRHTRRNNDNTNNDDCYVRSCCSPNTIWVVAIKL